MTELGRRLQKARISLQLSQDYVAKQLNIGRATVSQIEEGSRKVTSTELKEFSKVYGISVDELLSRQLVEMPTQVFARKFGKLNEVDQQEILNLMEFKRMMKDEKVND